LATHKSAMKRARQNERRRLRNKSIRTRVKNVIKKVRLAVERKSLEEAQQALQEAIPVIDKAASKGVLHKRNAARKISRLTRKVNQLAASQSS